MDKKSLLLLLPVPTQAHHLDRCHFLTHTTILTTLTHFDRSELLFDPIESSTGTMWKASDRHDRHELAANRTSALATKLCSSQFPIAMSLAWQFQLTSIRMKHERTYSQWQ